LGDRAAHREAHEHDVLKAERVDEGEHVVAAVEQTEAAGPYA
jgi:hypothetical protein